MFNKEFLDSPQFLTPLLIIVNLIFLPILIDTCRLLMKIRKRGLEHLITLADDGVSRMSLSESGLSGFFLTFTIAITTFGVVSLLFPNELSAPASPIVGFFGLCAAVVRQDLKEALRESYQGKPPQSLIVIEGEVVESKNQICSSSNNTRQLRS